MVKIVIKYDINNGITVVADVGNEVQDCANGDYLNELYDHSGFRYEELTYEAPATVKWGITVSATSTDDKLEVYSNYG